FGVAGIEDGFEEEEIGATVDEAVGVGVVAGLELVECDVAAEGQGFGGGSDGAGDKAGLRGRRKFGRALTSEARSERIEGVRFVFKTEFGKDDGRALETVGLQNVRAGFEVAAMNGEDPFGVRAAQIFAAVFKSGSAEIG